MENEDLVLSEEMHNVDRFALSDMADNVAAARSNLVEVESELIEAENRLRNMLRNPEPVLDELEEVRELVSSLSTRMLREREEVTERLRE